MELRIDRLSKQFGSHIAVDRVSATVTSASCSTIWTIMMYGISSRCSSVRLSRMACLMSGMWRCSDDPHKTRRIL